MAEDVEKFISTHSLLKPILIGHSMGAKVAMTLALRRPSAYSGLIPVDNSPVDAALRSYFHTYVNAMKEIADNSSIQKQSDADKVLEKYEKDVNIRHFLLMNFVRNKDGKYHFRIPLQTLAKSLPAMADFPFPDPDKARYEGPTLIVRGIQSHYVADETLPLIGRFFPKFELLSLDCGHWVMSERFDDFRQGVVEWVGRCMDGDK